MSICCIVVEVMYGCLHIHAVMHIFESIAAEYCLVLCIYYSIDYSCKCLSKTTCRGVNYCNVIAGFITAQNVHRISRLVCRIQVDNK